MISAFKNIIEKVSVSLRIKKEGGVVVSQKRGGSNQLVNSPITINQTIVQNFSGEEIEKIKDANLKKISDRIQQIPEERQVAIEPYKADNAIRKLQVVREETLSNMFVELIAKSADSKYEKEVIPRYQEIISNLSPNDAKILEIMLKGYNVTVPCEDLIKEKVLKESVIQRIGANMSVLYPIPGIPFLELQNKEKNKSSYYDIHKIFTDQSKILPNESIENIEASFYSLQALGLVEVRSGPHYLPLSIYSHLEEGAYVVSLKEGIEKKEDRVLNMVKGRIDITQFGRKFLSIVLRESNHENTE